MREYEWERRIEAEIDSYFCCVISTTRAMHPFGQLAVLAADAHEWRARSTARGATWAGLWPTALADSIVAQVLEHARQPDPELMSRLARRGAFPGVRNFSSLLAVLPIVAPAAEPAEEPDAFEDEHELANVLPIWNHGTFAQATLSDVRHAKHIVRVLDDYHEPTLAALQRESLRALPPNAGQTEHQAAIAAAAQAFLARPVRWRDVVERAVHYDTLRGLERQLGERMMGPRRSPADLEALVTVALEAIEPVSTLAAADARTTWRTQLASLADATVVLVYEEHAYLRLAGMQDGRSIRRHLPRGLHLVFSDQDYRRSDRTAGLWLEQSASEQRVDEYYWSEEIPKAYAERKRGPLFRLADADAVRRYRVE